MKRMLCSDQLEYFLNHQIPQEFSDNVFCSMTRITEYSVQWEIISGMNSMMWRSTTDSAIKVQEKISKSL